MVARESEDSQTICKMTSKGRGKGIERLKEIAKMNVRPPKAMLEELGRSRKEGEVSAIEWIEGNSRSVGR